MKNVLLVLSLFLSLSVFAEEYSAGDIVFGSTESPEFVLTESDACYETIKDLLYDDASVSDVVSTLAGCESDGSDYLLGLMAACDCGSTDPTVLAVLQGLLNSDVVFCCCVNSDGSECWSGVPRTCAICSCE